MNILGCGAAIPIGRHMTNSQLVNVHDKLFMVDCGEGTQTQVWKSGIKLTNMDNIFISHAHGDHFFGLVPLLSSLNLMLGRTKDINVFVPEDNQADVEELDAEITDGMNIIYVNNVKEVFAQALMH